MPEHLRAAIGRREITQSLKTSTLKEALKRRDILDVAWQARFDAHARNVEASLTADVPAFEMALHPDERRRLVREYVDERYRSFERDMAANGPETNDEKLDITQTCEEELSIPGNLDDPRRAELSYHTSRRILRGAGRSIEPGAVVESGMSDLVLRALIELGRRKLAFLKDDHQNAFFDHLFGTTSKTSLMVGELVDQFLKLQREEAVAKKSDTKGFERLTSYVKQLRARIGDTTSDLDP